MTRTSSLLLSVVVLVCGCVSLSVAAEPPLAAFGKEADVVLRLKRPKQTIEKAATMAAAAEQSLASAIRDNSQFIGLLISNPGLAGVDQEQDWLVVVFAHSDADPSVIFCIPATDEQAMQRELPKKMQAFARDGWVFYSEDGAAVERLQMEPPAEEAAITAEIDDPARQVFDRGDFSVFLNVDHLAEVYKSQLDQRAGQMAQRLIRQAGLLSMIPGLDVGGMVSGGASTGTDILRETRAFTTAVVFGEDGLNVETLAQFLPESATARNIAGHPGHPLPTVGQLPAGAVVYLGLSSSLSQGVENRLAASTALAEPMDERQQKLEDLKKTLESVEYRSFAVALGLGHRGEGLLRIVSITEAAPAGTVRDFKRASSELMNVELPGQGIKQESQYQPEAEMAGDRPVDVLTVTTTVDPNVNPFFASIIPQVESMLFGPRGLDMRFAYWDDKYVYSLGGGPEAMQAAVKQIESRESNGTVEFRKGLIEEPNVIVLLDVQRIAFRALKAAADAPELNLPVDPKVVGASEPEPSFVGFSLLTEPAALRTKSQVPSQQLYRIVQLGLLVQKLRERR